MDKKLELLKRTIKSGIEDAEKRENSALRDESAIFWNGYKSAYEAVYYMLVALDNEDEDETVEPEPKDEWTSRYPKILVDDFIESHTDEGLEWALENDEDIDEPAKAYIREKLAQRTNN
jgi:hypothetical protein